MGWVHVLSKNLDKSNLGLTILRMAGKYNIHKAESEKNVKEKDIEYHRSA